MEDILVNCNHCGNVLETTYNKQLETCPSCNSTLEIIKIGRSIYTKVCLDIAAIEALPPIKTSIKEPSKENVAIIKFNQGIYKRIADLDDKWNKDLQQHTKNGLLPVKSNDDEIAVAMIMVVLGFVFIMIAMNTEIIFFAVLGIGTLFYSGSDFVTVNTRKEKYFTAKKLYEEKRNELEDKLKIIPKSF